VRVGESLYGALVVAGGQRLDGEAALTADAIADNLALRLQGVALYSRAYDLQAELDESRRLATLGSFAAAVAHDIRTPLTSIQMNVQMLRRNTGLPPGDIGAHVSEILDFAKPVQLHPQPLDVREVAEEAAQRLGPILAERDLVLERRFAAALPLVRGDAVRIRQILLNLLDNAAQASSRGAAIVLSTRAAPAGRVAIEVIDAGRGIEAHDLPKIFEPFFTTRPDGTGLGLAIVQKVVRAHGGEISVHSTPGRGATFTVELPSV
jgi:two-component system sensor histidine kinase HydH